MTMTAAHNKKSQYKVLGESGSTFFYILLGVVLFATLAYVVSRGMRGAATSSMTARQTEIAASDIFNTAQKYAHTVDKLRRRGCSENDLSFANSVISGYEHTPAAPDECKIYHPEGGKMSYQAPLTDWLDGAQSAQTNYGAWFITGTSASDSTSGADEDLIMILPYVKRALCIEINDMLDVDNPSGAPPVDVSVAYLPAGKYTGSLPGPYNIQASGTELQDKESGCFAGGGTPAVGTYHFFSVLIQR